jgi:rod shape-determining protein MreC
MLSVPSRHRSLTLLAGALAVQLLLLAVQIKRAHQVRLIRVWAVELVMPLGRAATWTTGGIRGVWTHYIDLRHLRAENDQLQTEMDRLKLRNATLEGRAAEAARLSALLGFRQEHADVPMIAARVIGVSPDTTSRIVFLNRGSHDGIRPDMGVITPDGVVGKILAVFPDTSQVLLLNDKVSGVGALLADTRTQGPVVGDGGPTLSMEYVTNDAKVVAGETILTSGEDQIFPKDLPVGTVVKAQKKPHGSFQQIVVQPAAHLDRLEEVLVLMSRQEFASPPKPATSAAGAPSNAGPAPYRTPTPAGLAANQHKGDR